MKRRLHVWLAVGVVAVGAGIALIAGLLVWVTSTPPLHPDPEAVTSVAGVAPGKEWVTAVDHARRIVRAAMADQSLPGVSVAVGLGSDIVWAEGFGWADLESKTPVSADTRFRIGTQSILLTSAAAGLLIDRGRLRLDELVQTYVPSFPTRQWPVTIRHLMAHTGGVPTDGGTGPFGNICEHTVEGLRLFKNQDLRSEPGTQFYFSTFGWILMSAAIEAAADQPFLDFMRREIFEPAGMADTKADDAHENVVNRATSFFPRFATEPRYGLEQPDPLDFSCYSGAYIFLSTPSDMVRFAVATQNGRLVTRETVRRLQSPQRLTTGGETGYGLGWDTGTVTLAGTEARWFGHDGIVMDGQVSALISFPDRGLVVSVMSNISYTEVDAIAVKIAQAFAEARP